MLEPKLNDEQLQALTLRERIVLAKYHENIFHKLTAHHLLTDHDQQQIQKHWISQRLLNLTDKDLLEQCHQDIKAFNLCTANPNLYARIKEHIAEIADKWSTYRPLEPAEAWPASCFACSFQFSLSAQRAPLPEDTRVFLKDENLLERLSSHWIVRCAIKWKDTAEDWALHLTPLLFKPMELSLLLSNIPYYQDNILYLLKTAFLNYKIKGLQERDGQLKAWLRGMLPMLYEEHTDIYNACIQHSWFLNPFIEDAIAQTQQEEVLSSTGQALFDSCTTEEDKLSLLSGDNIERIIKTSRTAAVTVFSLLRQELKNTSARDRAFDDSLLMRACSDNGQLSEEEQQQKLYTLIITLCSHHGASFVIHFMTDPTWSAWLHSAGNAVLQSLCEDTVLKAFKEDPVAFYFLLYDFMENDHSQDEMEHLEHLCAPALFNKALTQENILQCFKLKRVHWGDNIQAQPQDAARRVQFLLQNDWAAFEAKCRNEDTEESQSLNSPSLDELINWIKPWLLQAKTPSMQEEALALLYKARVSFGKRNAIENLIAQCPNSPQNPLSQGAHFYLGMLSAMDFSVTNTSLEAARIASHHFDAAELFVIEDDKDFFGSLKKLTSRIIETRITELELRSVATMTFSDASSTGGMAPYASSPPSWGGSVMSATPPRGSGFPARLRSPQ